MAIEFTIAVFQPAFIDKHAKFLLEIAMNEIWSLAGTSILHPEAGLQWFPVTYYLSKHANVSFPNFKILFNMWITCFSNIFYIFDTWLDIKCFALPSFLVWFVFPFDNLCLLTQYWYFLIGDTDIIATAIPCWVLKNEQIKGLLCVWHVLTD